jgi:hypothetical protein
VATVAHGTRCGGQPRKQEHIARRIGEGSRIMHASRSLHTTHTRSLTPAMALALLSAASGVVAFFYLSPLLGPVALLTGYLALGRSDGGTRVLARTGIVLGISVLALYALLLMVRH